MGQYVKLFKETHRNDRVDTLRERLDSDRQRKSSTGSQASSVRSSGAPSQRTGDGGAHGPHSPLTDDEKFDKTQSTHTMPPSPRSEEYETLPAPPPKENPWAKRAQLSNTKPSVSSKTCD